jgi:hypothetical protein
MALYLKLLLFSRLSKRVGIILVFDKETAFLKSLIHNKHLISISVTPYFM